MRTRQARFTGAGDTGLGTGMLLALRVTGVTGPLIALRVARFARSCTGLLLALRRTCMASLLIARCVASRAGPTRFCTLSGGRRATG